MPTRSLLMVVTALAATPALAHPGEHGHMGLIELLQHYAEPDHLAFLALTVIVGVLAFKLGRRTEARARIAANSGRKEQP